MSLDGGNDGLYFYKNIISKWNNKLKKCGFFAFEIGYDQYEDVKDVLKNKNYGSLLYKDSHNNNRAIISSRTNYHTSIGSDSGFSIGFGFSKPLNKISTNKSALIDKPR